jgi:hypothetical protein
MTRTESIPSPAPLPTTDAPAARPMEKSELIERMATEMRVASGGELPLSFCIAQVKRQLAGKQAEASAANDSVASTEKKAKAGRGSVFHSWALPD